MIRETLTLKIKVLMPFVKSDMGGSYISASTLAGALSTPNFDVDVTAVFPSEGPAPNLFREEGVKVEIGNYANHRPLLSYRTKINKYYSTISRNLRILRFAYSYLKNHDYDIVHCNDDNSIIPWGIAAKLLGMKTIWHVRHADRGRADVIRERLADIEIYISKFATTRSTSDLPKNIVYNPIQSHIPNLSASYEPSDNGPLRIIHIGRDKPFKRTEWTIEAMRRLLESGYDAELTILGEFSKERQRELLRSYTNDQAEHVTFLGWVSNPHAYIAQSDILSHPARGETFGRVFVEAHAHGVPVLATRSGAAPEIVHNGETGLLSDVENLDEYSGMLQLFARDRSLIKVMRAKCEANAAKFSVDAHANAVHDIYMTAAGKVS